MCEINIRSVPFLFSLSAVHSFPGACFWLIVIHVNSDIAAALFCVCQVPRVENNTSIHAFRNKMGNEPTSRQLFDTTCFYFENTFPVTVTLSEANLTIRPSQHHPNISLLNSFQLPKLKKTERSIPIIYESQTKPQFH